MNIFSNLKVGMRMGAGFGLILILLTILMLIAINRLSFMQANIDNIVNQNYRKIELTNTMRDAVRFQAVALRDVVLQEDLAFKKSELKRMREARKNYQSAEEELEKVVSASDQDKLLSGIKESERMIQPAVDEVINFSLNDQHIEAGNAIRDKVRPAQIKLLDQLNEMLAHFEKDNRQAATDTQHSYRITQILLFVLGAIAMVLGAAIAYFTTQSITQPLHVAVAMAEKISQGDLTSKLQQNRMDELGNLLDTLQKMNLNLSNIIGGVKTASGSVANSSITLSDSAGKVSQRAETQSEQVMQIGAAMEEMSVSISEVAVGAGSVSDAAIKTRKIAESGSENIIKSVNASKRIADSVNASSNSISELSLEIIKINEVAKVIKDIAEQTNLLALNAAIEAARAGEQGRGFAVVADEVRKLAERTAISTNGITETVASISGMTDAVVKSMGQVQDDVNDGIAINQGTQEILSQIAVSAKEVSVMAQDIAAATSEQKLATSDTAVSMEKISVMTEENTHNIHAVTSAADSLAETATDLKRLVEQFKLA